MSSGDLKTGAMERRIEGDAVLPASPNDAQPSSGEDADGVWVPASAVDGSFVDVGSPGIGQAAAIGEIHDRDAELLVARPSERGPLVLA